MPEVRLREVRDEDLPFIYEQQRDPASVAMAGVPARDRDAFDAHWARNLADPANVLRVIDVDGAVAGTCVSFLLDGRRMVGYWLAREHWGAGIASRAFALFLGELEERPLWATVLPGNAGSRRVLEKNGFIQTRPPDGYAELLYVLT
jgi:RimJ/RimL family protein N-acetyltransferase